MSAKESVSNLLRKIALEDDQASFKQLYFQYYREVFSVAKFYVRDATNAEEIANEVFVRIWNKRETLQEVRSFTSYIYRTAKNQSLNYITKNKLPAYVDVEDVSDILDSEPSVIERLAEADLAKQINMLISQLPHKSRLVFILIKNDGLSYVEVAKLLNISVKTVEYHMAVSLKKMAHSLNHIPRFMDKSNR